MIYVNKFDTAKGIMIAMCDEELIGRVLREGKVEIDLKQYGSFYKGVLVNEIEAEKYVTEKVYSANVVGERSVNILLEKGIVKKDQVRKCEGVSYVHLFRVLK